MTPRVPDAVISPVMVEATQAERRFGPQTVFGGVDLVVRSGERLHLRGANGSGKTTLLRCILGTLQLSGGTMRVVGRDPRHAGGRVGACLNPEMSLYARLTGHDNLLFAARLRMSARAARQAVRAIEGELELGNVAPVRVDRCSAGMRARLSVARALLAEPALVLLDEPTRSLDEHAHAMVWQALDRRPDLAVVITSHRPEDGEHCHRTYDLPGHV